MAATMEELIASAKEAAAALYGSAAQQTRDQAAQIQQSYATAQQGVRDVAGASVGREATARQADRQAAEGGAARLGVKAGAAGAATAGSDALSQMYAGQTYGDSNAWDGYFGARSGTALGRNQSTADTFDNANHVEQISLDNKLANYIASQYGSGGGGGGGGRGGGGGYDDEPVWEPPNTLDGDLAQQARTNAASQGRYEGMAARYAANPTNSASGGKSGTRAKTKAPSRKGKGGSF